MDEGVGIHDIESIFTSKKGGLTISNSIALCLGGSLSVVSLVDKGSEFSYKFVCKNKNNITMLKNDEL